MRIECEKQEAREIYKMLIGLIGPRPIGWISTISKEGVHNLAPYSFFNMFSMNPAIIGFSGALNRDGQLKDSLRNAKETGEFVHNVATTALVEALNETSAEWEFGVSEFEKVGLTPLASDFVKAPRVKEAAASLECRVTQIVSLGSKPGNGQLCLGEVVAIHIQDEKILGEDHLVLSEKLALLSRLGRTDYMEPGRVFSLKRPEAKT